VRHSPEIRTKQYLLFAQSLYLSRIQVQVSNPEGNGANISLGFFRKNKTIPLFAIVFLS